MLISIISVSVLTSIITSDMVDSTLDVYGKRVVVVKDSWEDFLARLLVNHKRSTKTMLIVDNYTELLDVLADNTTLDVGLVDNYILSPLQDAMTERDLGLHCLG